MKPLFQLEPGTRVHITSTTIGREKHGEDKVPAFYVGVRWQTSNDALKLLDSRLKAALYQKAKVAAGDDDAAQKVLDLPVSDLPSLRFPDLGPQEWTRELLGYAFTVWTPNGSSVTLADCTVRKIGWTCLEGGSLIVVFQVQSSAVNGDAMGALGVLLDHDVEVALTPPDKTEQAEIGNGDGKGPWPFPPGADATQAAAAT